MDEYLFDTVSVHGDESFLDYLDEKQIKEYLVPSTEKWDNVSPSNGFATKLSLDDSKVDQWQLAKEEIMHQLVCLVTQF